MTEHLQKLMAQLALLFVVLWVVGAALGKKSQVTLSGGAQNVPGGCNPYGGEYSHYGSAAPYQASPARAPWAV